MRKALALLLVLLVVSVSGCIGTTENPTNTATTEASSAYVTVTDLLGRTVEVPAQVTKVVAAGPGALRLMVYLNASGMVIGVEDFEKRYNYGRPYIIAHPELKELPTIGPGGPGKLPDLEALVKLKPDVIFITYVDAKTADDIQEKTGVPVVVLSYGQLATFDDEELFKSLELAGKILGKEKRAEEVINFVKSIQDDLMKRTENVESPAVYVGGIGYKGAHGIESTEAKYPPFVVVHAKNVADELGDGHKFIDKEQLLEWNPDYIFIDEGGLKLVLDDYQKDPDFYNSLKAVREGNVYGILPYNFYTTNIGTALADAYFIGKVLYPERFEDIDPVEKADEIYTFLLGKPVYSVMAEQFGGFGKIDLANGTVKYSLPTSP
ncbi:iron ABC transporter substrate-binding protein [Thermococcus sp. GR7]|uniref:iron ABC transporter substrate-binding protein n=1 Tax=unclassified Thermococcus TaxID=2627626 RepID=UPI00142F7B8A|nr:MULTISPECIES: iron ABC transporter substrate-binding protein [unclassified Thermococcus]NJE46235.1 iron ABC transporter substrate-binding protein [Thermococcus sp. GR7]NJE79490.1 iron ABC transporter substrate-binding protein [Thermococcus sp. GR4]NJF23885.1 iron ABC transporter substrate-binding protein [Thermococcus sp. GR5]